MPKLPTDVEEVTHMRPIAEVKSDLWTAVSNANSVYEREILRLILEIADHVENCERLLDGVKGAP